MTGNSEAEAMNGPRLSGLLSPGIIITVNATQARWQGSGSVSALTGSPLTSTSLMTSRIKSYSVASYY